MKVTYKKVTGTSRVGERASEWDRMKSKLKMRYENRYLHYIPIQ